VDGKPRWTEHPLFKEGMARFESKEWEGAIDSLSRLLAEFPGDRELEQILADLRLKSSVSERAGRPARIVRTRLRRALILALGIVALVAVAAALSYGVYSNWVRPARTASEQLRDLGELHELARGYVAAGDYAKAAEIYQEILAEAPDDGAAAAGLERAQTLQTLSVAYDEALELTRQERWEEALEAWQEILAVDPNFRDVTDWAALAREQDVLGTLFKDAETMFERGDWTGAAESLEQLRGEDSSYRRDEVETMLASSLVNEAEQMLGEASDPAAVYDQAMALFDRAIAVRPEDESLVANKAVAEAYGQGYSYLQEGDCETAGEKLRIAYDHDPGYAEGKAADLLYDAYIACGDAQASAGDLQAALAYYAAASQLTVSDVSAGRAKQTAVVAMLTATPTTRPKPPSPTATQRAVRTPTRSPYAYEYVEGSAQSLVRPGCQAPSIEGRVIDRAGLGLPGLWVRLEWWGNRADVLTGYDGEFGFAPLALEHFASSVPFRLTVIQSPTDASPLSPSVALDFEGCSTHDGFTNIIFQATG
jgi:tetratricopeptide (TPR) repeat protein